MTTFVKFCGLRRPDDVARAPPGGAAGFVIGVPSSPRSQTPAQAAALLGHLPTGVEAWAVLVRPTAEQVRAAFDEIGVDRVQVHGPVPEGLEPVERHHVVPSLSLAAGTGAPFALPPRELFPRIHLDAGDEAQPGGTGRLADWDRAAQLIADAPDRKVLLAGGLTPENVGAAIRRARPWGVDVSSGIERAPGEKDPERMARFLLAVREAEHRA